MKIPTSRIKEIIKEELAEAGPDPRTAQSQSMLKKGGVKDTFVLRDLYWINLLLRMAQRDKKLDLRLLSKYTAEVSRAAHTIELWNGMDDYQKKKSTIDKKEVLQAKITLKDSGVKDVERWLTFHDRLRQLLKDMEGGFYEEVDAKSAERYVTDLLNNEGYQAILNAIKKQDPAGQLSSIIRGSGAGSIGRAFTRSRANQQAAPRWRKAVEPIRRGLEKFGIREMIDEELEAVLAEKDRTAKGNVTQDAREKYATVGDDGFPIFDKKSGEAAIKLRGHAQEADQEKIIDKAAKYAPKAAKKARKAEKKEKSKKK